MPTTTTPVVLDHPLPPCPDWCDGCEKYDHQNWSDYADHATRPHEWRTAVRDDEPVVSGWTPARAYWHVDITSTERYQRTPAGDLAHEYSPVRVGLVLCVHGHRVDEVSVDLSPEQTDQLAQALQDAADQARGIEGRA